MAPDGTDPTVEGTLIFLLAALVVEQIVAWFLLENVLKPTGRATNLASRVAQGDLSLDTGADGKAGKDALTTSLATMLDKLRELVGTIRQHAHEAAAMSQEIAASTEQMTASTQEVASTTGDLTERANQQAVVVRAAAEDAGKILDIAQELAAGATQAAERNAALARLARSHRERLDVEHGRARPAGRRGRAGGGRGRGAGGGLGGDREVRRPRPRRSPSRPTCWRSTPRSRPRARARRARASASSPRRCESSPARRRAPAGSTSETVQIVLARVRTARERLLRLGQGGLAAKDAAHEAAAGLLNVAADAEANDEWTRRISASASEVRGLIEGIAGRMREVSAGTEDYAAAAEEIAAAAQQLNASTEEISSSATHLADAAERLTGAVGGFKLS